jgi:membrane-bound lytic murein transglycosylase MltF
MCFMQSPIGSPGRAALALLVLLGCGNGADSSGDGSRPEAGSSASEEASSPSSQTSGGGNVLVERVTRPRFGDLAEMRERRLVRVLVSYGKTNFFFEGATARGFELELVRLWEKALNEGVPLADKIKVAVVPTPFERLVDNLVAGLGDVAAAGLTITPARSSRVDFTRPYFSNVQEVVVSNRNLPELTGLEDLSGRRVVVRTGSSYAEHLAELDGDIGVVLADHRLVTEDLLELVSSGAIELTVADQHLAEAWSGVLPDLRIHADLAVHSGGDIAWAVRKESTELRANLDQFMAEHRKGTLLGNILLKRYFSNSKWIENPLSPSQLAKLQQLVEIFQRYGEEYDFDWLALAAQGYQESKLEQDMRSSAGAIGVMQLLQSTAEDRWVNITDIEEVENNIHAGAKYLAFLRDRYFDDDAIDPQAQVDFAWAAYNAGPARVRRLRAKAEERGLDPNQWFGHVERLAAEEIGRETVDYVANINKYYLAYRLQYDANLARLEARSMVAGD